MKVLVNLMTMAFLVFAANPLLAKEENSLETLVSVKVLEPGKVQVAYYGKATEVVRVSIYDNNDKAVFEESIRSTGGVKKPYNLRELPYGNYKFKVRVNDEFTVHDVEYKAPMYPGNVKMQVKAIDGDKIKMMVMGPGYKDFKLRIYNENNKLLHQQVVRQKDNYGRVFNLKGTNTQSVKVVLSNNTQILQRKTINL